jgi:hypothetical protein
MTSSGRPTSPAHRTPVSAAVRTSSLLPDPDVTGVMPAVVGVVVVHAMGSAGAVRVASRVDVVWKVVSRDGWMARDVRMSCGADAGGALSGVHPVRGVRTVDAVPGADATDPARVAAATDAVGATIPRSGRAVRVVRPSRPLSARARRDVGSLVGHPGDGSFHPGAMPARRLRRTGEVRPALLALRCDTDGTATVLSRLRRRPW